MTCWPRQIPKTGTPSSTAARTSAISVRSSGASRRAFPPARASPYAGGSTSQPPGTSSPSIAWIIATALVRRQTVRLRVEGHRFAAGGLDRAEVGRVVRGSAQRTAGHTDPGLGHVGDPSRARGVIAASTRDEAIGEPISLPKRPALVRRRRRTLLRSRPLLGSSLDPWTLEPVLRRGEPPDGRGAEHNRERHDRVVEVGAGNRERRWEDEEDADDHDPRHRDDADRTAPFSEAPRARLELRSSPQAQEDRDAIRDIEADDCDGDNSRVRIRIEHVGERTG